MGPTTQIRSGDPGKTFFGSLESLRGAAALLVAFYHVSWLNPVHQWGVVRNSYLMVDMFFVLSGFVMCHGYGDRIKNRSELRDFFTLRFGRLYPLHLALLGVFMAREIARFSAERWFNLSSAVPAFAENTGWAFVSNLLLVQSLGLHSRLTFNEPSWSISAEFYTYILFAIAVLAMRNWRKPAQLAALIAISAVSFGVLLVAGRHDLNVMYDFGWFRCTTGFFLGAASYTVFSRLDVAHRPALQRACSYVAAAGLIGGVLFLALKVRGRSDFLFPPLTALLVVALAGSPGSLISRWLRNRFLTYLGKVSYSIYMVHFVLAWLLGSTLVRGLGIATSTDGQVILTGQLVGTSALLVYIGLVLFFSHLTFSWIEEPFRLKTKARVVNRRARRTAAESAPNRARWLTVPSA